MSKLQRDLLDALVRIERKIDLLAGSRSKTRPPISFSTGHRPAFWHDNEVREWVLANHRRMGVVDAVAELSRLFGCDRVPSKSALGRVWRRMDRMRRAA